ncbi:MAG: tryptophanase, partial [Planctomycetes bacterium]|nr:tryptophanase [Planctomycetota bacterium]
AGQRNHSIAAIARMMFDLVDGCTMSAKKDGLANIGGFIACRDAALADELRTRLVVTEGFPTYGGLAGRDLEAIAQGLREVVEQDYQEYRHASIRYVVERLAARGVPVMQPAGGHAIFLDAAKFLPHLSWREYPGQALAIELYLAGGIRACEIGTVMLGHVDAQTGEETPAEHELVRLAVPRRTYTQSHMDYVIEVVEDVWQRRASIPGVRIERSPRVLRHFRARFARLPLAVAAAR